MISKGSTTLTVKEVLNRVSESELLAHYLGITAIPTVINSPLRKDNNPSFGLFSPDGIRVHYKDFANGDRGGILDLLKILWNCQLPEVLSRIVRDNVSSHNYEVSIGISLEHHHSITYEGNTYLSAKEREWKQYDLDYWEMHGISLSLLKKANVHPISHYIITKNGKQMIFGADKLAYAYVEFKEGNTSIKVYQPYNKSSFKWISKHDRSVLGLWNLMPEKGKIVCICASVKDALCLYANTGIPAICLQGEAYGVSKTAQKVLKDRFENVCILLDSDAPGKADAVKLSESTGFINVALPESQDYKDIAEMYIFLKDKELFKKIIINQFKNLKLC